MAQNQSQLNLVHTQVKEYLKKRLPKNQDVYTNVDTSYFFQEQLDENHYRATIILNGSDCYYVCLDIPDVENSSQVDFTLLKEIVL